MDYRISSVVVIILMTLAGFLGMVTLEPELVSALPSHGTIYINGNENFTSGNGVVSGNGTSGNPYIISDYDISASSTTGIDIRNTQAYFIIRNMSIHSGGNSHDGIYFYNARNGKVQNTSITNIRYGIYFRESSRCEVINNNVTSSQTGIYLQTSHYNNITGNNVSAAQSYCIYLTSSTENRLDNNNVWNSPLYIVSLVSSSENKLINNSLWDTDFYGLYLSGSNSNDIIGNNVTDTMYAVYIFSSSNNNLVKGNNISNNWAAVNMRSSSSATVVNNYIYSNIDYGIYTLGPSNNNNISGNTVVANGYGIQFSSPSSGNVVLENIVIGNTVGIHLMDSDTGNEIKANNVSKNNIGIKLEASSNNNELKKNNVTDNEDGIVIEESSNNDLIENNVRSNNQTGIYLSASAQNTLAGNAMVANGIFIGGDEPGYWNSHNIDTSNTVNTKPVYYWKDQLSGTVPAGAGQVILANCRNVLVTGQLIENCSVGIELGFSMNNVLADNVVKFNKMSGILLYESRLNTITETTSLYNNDSGIKLDTSTNNIINNNTCKLNKKSGIHIISSKAVIIENNTCSLNNDSGIYVFHSEADYLANNTCNSNDNHGIYCEVTVNSVIFNNTLSSNVENGVHLLDSYTNFILENTIIDNSYGVYLQSSNYNEIYHNRFIDNQDQNYDNSIATKWDNSYPSGGNYWSDYTGTDQFWGPDQDELGSDGIGDTPYLMPFYRLDRYPLMKPYGDLPTAPRSPDAEAGDAWINLTWLPPAQNSGFPIIHYTIYRGTFSDNENFFKKVDNVTFYNDTSVNNNITYYYKISGESIVGEGPLSEEVFAKPEAVIKPKAVPSMPLNLTAEPEVAGINLTWRVPLSDGNLTITNYRLYKGTTSDLQPFLEQIGNVLQYTDTNITPGINYYYKVSAVNPLGEGPVSLVANALIKGPPGEPVNVTVASGDSYVMLNWSPPLTDGGASIIKYNVYRSTEAGDDNPPLLQARTATYYNDTGVENGMTYYYSISAVNSYGEGTRSGEIEGRPEEAKNQPPSLSLDATVTNGKVPLTVAFICTAFDTDGIIASYHWDFDDGSNSTKQNPVHIFEKAGTYNVTLTVTDNRGATNINTITIVVTPGPGDIIVPDNGKPPDGEEPSSDEKVSTAPDKKAAGIALAAGTLIIVVFLVIFALVMKSKSKIAEVKVRRIEELDEDELEE